MLHFLSLRIEVANISLVLRFDMDLDAFKPLETFIAKVAVAV